MSLVELVRRFARPLNQLKIPYMATGAVAAIVYGEPRLTLDLDLVLQLGPDVASGFLESYPTAEFYVPPLEVVREEVRRASGGHFNLLHRDSGLRADIYLASDDPLDRWGLARRRQETVGGEPVWIAPPEYVIVRKLEYFRAGGSSKHLDDIRAILRVSGPGIERDSLNRFVRERGLSEEWAEVATRA